MFDTNSGQGTLRHMAAADLASVLAMRNHKEIRRHMLTQHEISLEEHMSWFKRASENPDLDLLVLEIEGKCCGFVQFKRSTCQGIVDWGFYVAPDASKGTGKKLGVAALNHAFKKKENLHKICGQAIHSNQPSIKFHKSIGFTQEGILRDQYFDGVSYHDLICFGILKHEWLAIAQQTGIRK